MGTKRAFLGVARAKSEHAQTQCQLRPAQAMTDVNWLRRGKEVIYWPGMNKNIEDFISTCSTCKSYQANQQNAPMISQEIPR